MPLSTHTPRFLTITTHSLENSAHAKIGQKKDFLALEEPLEIIIDYAEKSLRKRLTVTITMRTPGHDQELAAGFLFSEGIIRNKDDILDISTDPEAANPDNSVVITLSQELPLSPEQLLRHSFTNSSCGVCGKTSMQALELRHQPRIPPGKPKIPTSILQKLPDTLREHQAQFVVTGGVHASALFSPAGELLLLKEDIGRHNAMDKLIGALLLSDQLGLARQSLILASGRTSFELVQKALMADIPALASIGAPSSLAAQLADRHSMTLIGFLKSDGFNVYSGIERIT